MKAWWKDKAHLIVGLGTAAILVGMAASQCGCASPLVGAQVFKTQASKALHDFADGFDRFDQAEQDKIVANSQPGSTLANLDLYIERTQKPIRVAVVAVKGAMAAYAGSLSAAMRGLKADWLGLALALVRAGAELTETLKRVGVQVPFALPAFLGGG